MFALALAAMLVVACANDVESQGQPNAGEPADLATNLDVPWGIAFLPDGSALIAERNSGTIKHMSAPGEVNLVGSVAGVAARGEGGLLGLATSGPTVFAYFTAGQDNRVVRMRFEGGMLREQSPILTGIPAGAIHDGGRIAFGPAASCMWRRGRAAILQLAQDRASLGGKILASTPTGRLVDNPDPASSVWSFGHRNIQGLAWGFGWPTVDHRVRRESVGRAQLDQAGRQLRVAHGRGSGRHPGTDRPGNPVGDPREAAALGAGLLRWRVVGRVPSRSAALSDTGRCRRLSGRSRGRCLSDSTGVCARSPRHRTARCGSPPATVTAGGVPAMETTASFSSGRNPTHV